MNLLFTMKTICLAHVLCLNIGVDPPDVIKISLCARMECWIEVSRHGREHGSLYSIFCLQKKKSKKVVPPFVWSVTSNEGASTSGVTSQTSSGVLSGSDVLNARPGSTTSSGSLSQMVSPFTADAARKYLEKVADLLSEFA